MIELKDISKTYRMGALPVNALRDVTLSVGEGEFVAVMGPSGSGKSTLLNVIGCIDRPSGGAYVFRGKEVASLPDRSLARIRNREIGFIFQNFNLLWNETAQQNVMLPLIYDGSPDRKGRARRALEAVGLGHRLRHRPGELSGGEQQRVAVARALASNPRLLLCDEPTGALDFETGKQVLGMLGDLNRRLRKTVVLITHNTSIPQIGDRVARLLDGTIQRVQVNAQPKTVDEVEW